MPVRKIMEVRTSREKLQTLIHNDFEIAAINSDNSCYISCETENYLKVKKLLESEGMEYIDLNTSHPFLSASFEPILSEFSAYVDQFRIQAPEIPFISCLTGRFITPEQAVSGTYWSQQLLNTIQFRDGVTLLGENDNVMFLEVGPNHLLSSLVRENSAVKNKEAIISTLGKPGAKNEAHRIINALGKLYNIGFDPSYFVQPGDKKPMKISLPTYPFNRSRHWIEFEYPKAFGK